MTVVFVATITVLAGGLAWTLLRSPSAATRNHQPSPNSRARVTVIEAGPDTTTALLAEPHHPPAGWEPTAHPNLWISDPRRHPDALHVATELMQRPTHIGNTAAGARLVIDEALTSPHRPPPKTEPPEPAPAGPTPTNRPPSTAPKPSESPERRDRHVVRIYGNVGLNDRHANPRPRTLELITYIAFHPGATTDDIKTALWPDQPITPSAFNNCVTAARRTLGQTASGEHHLPVAANARYTLGDNVTTDAHTLTAALAAKDLDTIRDVLNHVRGLPFTSPSGYHWTHEEGLDSAATATIVRAGDTLARAALTEGNTTDADWAARTALLAAPGDRRLWLIRILCAPGPAALEQVTRQLITDNVELDHELADAYRARGGQRCIN